MVLIPACGLIISVEEDVAVTARRASCQSDGGSHLLISGSALLAGGSISLLSSTSWGGVASPPCFIPDCFRHLSQFCCVSFESWRASSASVAADG